MNDYKTANNSVDRYMLSDWQYQQICLEGSWTNENAPAKTDEFLKIVETSERKIDLIETDDGKEYVNKISNELLKLNNFERHSQNTSEIAVFAERFSRTIRNLSKKPVFEEGKDSMDKSVSICQQNIQHYQSTLNDNDASSNFWESKSKNRIFQYPRQQRKTFNKVQISQFS